MRLSVGVVPSIKAAIFALTEKDDKVLIQTPVYPPFYSSVKMLKRTLVTNPLHFDGEKYNIDFDDFEEKIRSGVKLFILCNPHNPVGRCWTEEELRKLADICYNYNVKIVSDEIHSDIIYKNFRHHVLNTVSEKARNISVICQAPSKTFNIAGLCLSCVIVENEVIRKQMWEAMYAIGTDTVNLFGLTAAETAYNQGEIWVDEMVGYVEENAEFVCRYINENMPKVKAYKPQATYLMWLDFGKYDMTQAELMVKLVKEAKVVLNSGTDFGDEGKGYVRLNIGCPRSMVEESLARIKAAFDAAD
jgi:cystathionine beta-lyase